MTAGRMAGRVAVVTGAARGIGRACALRLAEEGADIAALDIGAAMPTVPYRPSSTAQLQETASAVRTMGRRCVPLIADVRDGAAMRQAVAAAVSELGIDRTEAPRGGSAAVSSCAAVAGVAPGRRRATAAALTLPRPGW